MSYTVVRNGTSAGARTLTAEIPIALLKIGKQREKTAEVKTASPAKHPPSITSFGPSLRCCCYPAITAPDVPRISWRGWAFRVGAPASQIFRAERDAGENYRATTSNSNNTRKQLASQASTSFASADPLLVSPIIIHTTTKKKKLHNGLLTRQPALSLSLPSPRTAAPPHPRLSTNSHPQPHSLLLRREVIRFSSLVITRSGSPSPPRQPGRRLFARPAHVCRPRRAI